MYYFTIKNFLGVKKISDHAHNTGCWYLLGVLFKISDKHPPPCRFYMEVLSHFTLSSVRFVFLKLPPTSNTFQVR